MTREAFFIINCGRYSENLLDFIKLLEKIGWSAFTEDRYVEYLPVGDIDDYDWQKERLSIEEMEQLICSKQANAEKIGLNLFHADSHVGITLLADNTKEIMLSLSINRKSMRNTRCSITDVSWYIEHILEKLEQENCPVDYIQFEDYTD